MNRRATWIAVLVVCAYPFISTVLPAQVSWQLTGGPYTAKINRLALGRNNVVLAATHQGGIYSCPMGVGTWSYLALGGKDVTSLVVTAGGAMYAGTSAQLLTSADDGVTWSLNPLPANQTAGMLIVDSAGTVYVGGLTGMHRSMDGGATWEERNGGLTNLMLTALGRSVPGTMFAGFHYGGLFRSSDLGGSWTKSGSEFEGVSVRSIVCSDAGTLYAGASGLGVYASTDDGATWTVMPNGMDRVDVEVVYTTFAGTLFAGTMSGRLYRCTSDTGAWEQVLVTPHQEAVLSVLEGGDGTLYAGTQWAGVYASIDGGATWTASSSGLVNSDATSLVMAPSGRMFMTSSGFNDVLLSADEGATWVNASGGKTIGARQLAVNADGRVYVATARGVMHTTNDGFSWEFDTSGLTTLDIRTIGVNARNHVFACAGNGTLFRSTDGGYSWQKPATGLGGSVILCYLFPSPNVIWVGTERHRIYRSLDNGNTWTQVSTGLTRDLISALAYSPTYGMFAGSYGEMYHSSDEGAMWKRISYDLLSGTINTIHINSGGVPVIGMEYRGVAYLDWNKQQWMDANSGNMNPTVHALVLHSNGSMYAATQGNGVLKSTGVPTAAESPGAARAGAFALGQCYPQPAGAGTVTIPFTLAQDRGVAAELTVTTLLGQTLLRRRMDAAQPGRNAFQLDASLLAPGVYTCTVTVAGSSQSRLLHVLR